MRIFCRTSSRRVSQRCRNAQGTVRFAAAESEMSHSTSADAASKPSGTVYGSAWLAGRLFSAVLAASAGVLRAAGGLRRNAEAAGVPTASASASASAPDAAVAAARLPCATKKGLRAMCRIFNAFQHSVGVCVRVCARRCRPPMHDRFEAVLTERSAALPGGSQQGVCGRRDQRLWPSSWLGGRLARRYPHRFAKPLRHTWEAAQLPTATRIAQHASM